MDASPEDKDVQKCQITLKSFDDNEAKALEAMITIAEAYIAHDMDRDQLFTFRDTKFPQCARAKPKVAASAGDDRTPWATSLHTCTPTHDRHDGIDVGGWG